MGNRNSTDTRATTSLWAIVLLGIFCIGKASAQGQAQFTLPADLDALVLSYSETSVILAGQDSPPRIRVYASGRVHVHYPAYMKKAGDYEFFLNRGQLNSLLVRSSILVGFNEQQANQELANAKQQRMEATGLAYARSDADIETFEIILENFSDGRSRPTNVNRKLTWRDLPYDAKQHPQVSNLGQLNGIRNSIRALLESHELQPIQGVNP